MRKVKVGNVENWNIKNTQEKNNDMNVINENEEELLKIYRSLPFRNKHEIMSILYKMENESDKI